MFTVLRISQGEQGVFTIVFTCNFSLSTLIHKTCYYLHVYWSKNCPENHYLVQLDLSSIMSG